MMILDDFKSNPLVTVISPLADQYGLIAPGTLCLSGQPSLEYTYNI